MDHLKEMMNIWLKSKLLHTMGRLITDSDRICWSRKCHWLKIAKRLRSHEKAVYNVT